jgi:hypothetical protein
MQTLNERITSLDNDIAALSSQQTGYRHLLTFPGVGSLDCNSVSQRSWCHTILKWARIIGVVRTGSPPAQFGRKTAPVFCEEKWQPEFENPHYSWCAVCNALCEKA